MSTRNTIEFITTDKPITDVVTKFGGQPNWLEEPQWPISSELDSQMRFICQIKLTNRVTLPCEMQMEVKSNLNEKIIRTELVLVVGFR